MIGFLTAIDEEFQVIKESLKELKVEKRIGRDFYVGNYKNKQIALTKTGIGKVAAALSTTILIEIYKCEKIIFLGTAGALDTALKVGDIVIAESLVQHDCDSRPFVEKQFLPSLNIKYLSTDKLLQQICYDSADNLLKNNVIKEDLKKKLNIGQIQLVQGVIVSGDQFISTQKQKQEILQFTPEAKVVEMEGAACGQVCIDAKVPCCVVRLVSDDASDVASCDFMKFCEYFAGFVLNQIFERIIEKV